MPQKFALEVVLMTCREREVTRGRTLASLAETDYQGEVWTVVDSDVTSAPSRARSVRNFQRALHFCSDFTTHYLGRPRFVLLLEDDLTFNRHLEHNLQRWLARDELTGVVGSLYRTALGGAIGNQALLATPKVFGSLALRADSLPWRAIEPQDVWLRRVATVRHHEPSLVNHDDNSSTLGHERHRACDFNPHWRSP